MRTEVNTEAFIIDEVEAPAFANHPAKMLPGLALRLIQEYSIPNEIVLDPFAGIGTVLWAAHELDRRSIGVEIESEFAGEAAKFCDKIFVADARDLPIKDGSIDLVLTSPPYGEAIGRAGDRDPKKTAAAKIKYETRRFGRLLTKHAVYGVSPNNLGSLPLERLNKPCFIAEMPVVMKEITRVLRPEGIALLVVRDQRKGRKRLGAFDLPGTIVKWATEAELVYQGRRAAIIPEKYWTLWQRVNEKRWGIPISNVEHIVVLSKRKRQ